jgi:hypothetical protein
MRGRPRVGAYPRKPSFVRRRRPGEAGGRACLCGAGAGCLVKLLAFHRTEGRGCETQLTSVEVVIDRHLAHTPLISEFSTSSGHETQ